MQKTAVLCRKTDFLNIYHLSGHQAYSRKTIKQAHPCLFLSQYRVESQIMPTIIIIHSSKYSVLFRFISSRCTWIRYSDVQYFPIHVLSMLFFFQNVHSCQFWSAANIFPFISMPIWTYELLLISDLQNRIPPDSGIRADSPRGEVSLFSIFFSDLMSDVFCIDITLLVL